MSEHPPATDDLAWAVHHLAVAAAELDAAIARRMGLTGGDYLALKHLSISGDPMGPVELGRLLGITSGAATGLVDRLERHGLAERRPHPTDRRRQTVVITPHARQRLVDELRPLADDIAGASAALTGPQRRTVTDTLGRLADLHRRHAR
ncbi:MULTISPECIES: MarR family winged helix-turn-helix transcriptional regulator [Catenuloplanes]|uniref:DNA-binding MarR family transcriptional regulator n=1 Tax=Catenuloplanes niger TaxID=587534 RepID=A0AAE3ZYA0_9ACTN|nr:MarR family transcriptional regulator [Catenuloplanes niger]MDR7328132.1 DNA-binding MarR family transcriptional regulator [Catenuloplanes niger]